MRFGANAPVILGYCDWLILVVLPACHDNYRSYGSVGTPHSERVAMDLHADLQPQDMPFESAFSEC